MRRALQANEPFFPDGKTNAARVFDIDVKRRALCRNRTRRKGFFLHVKIYRYMDSEETTHIADLLSWHNQTLIGTHNFA